MRHGLIAVLLGTDASLFVLYIAYPSVCLIYLAFRFLCILTNYYLRVSTTLGLMCLSQLNLLSCFWKNVCTAEQVQFALQPALAQIKYELPFDESKKTLRESYKGLTTWKSCSSTSMVPEHFLHLHLCLRWPL